MTVGAARFLVSVVLPRSESRALHSAALRSASASPIGLRPTLDTARSSTWEKRAGGPERRVAQVGLRVRRVGLRAGVDGSAVAPRLHAGWA